MTRILGASAQYSGPPSDIDELLNGYLVACDCTLDQSRQFVNSIHAEFVIGKCLDVSQLTDYAIHYLFQESISTNVLTNGYRWRNGYVECEFVSCATNILESGQWQWLCSQMGPCWYLFLMFQAAVFKPLPNRCYLQLTGDDVTLRLGRTPSTVKNCTRPSTLALASRILIHKVKVMGSEPIRNARAEIMTGFPRYFILYGNSVETIFHTIFPIQFGLSSPLVCRSRSGYAEGAPINMPRRLHKMANLFKSVLARHRNLPYHLLFNRICVEPCVPVADGSLHDLTVPYCRVQMFCKVIVKKIYPSAVFGSSENWQLLFNHIDSFVKARRGESFSLLFLFQKFKIKDIPWLGPPGKMSRPDFEKRQQLLLEFLHWFFDRFLVALLRNNFYSTSTSTDPCSIYYYRHEVWQAASQYALLSFKQERLSLAKPSEAASSTLGSSRVRVVPRETGYRILNLMGRSDSVNSKLRYVQAVLSAEMVEPHGVASLRSVSDVLLRIQEFRDSIIEKCGTLPRLYFVKVDITKSFDTIPLKLAHALASKLVAGETYWIHEITSIDARLLMASYRGKQLEHAHDLHRSNLSGSKTFSRLSFKKPCQIFVDRARGPITSKAHVLDILSEHLRHGLINIDGTVYRQNEGIPQGSCLSGFLCNLVYDDLETNLLSVNPKTGLLLRYVDDFLLISTSRSEAETFLQRMTIGFASHGANINPAKTVTNFSTSIVSPPPNKLSGQRYIHYLGLPINIQTLDPGYKVNLRASKLQARCMPRTTPGNLHFFSKKLITQLRRKLGQELAKFRCMKIASSNAYWSSICTVTAVRLITFVLKSCQTINYNFISDILRGLIRIIVQSYSKEGGLHRRRVRRTCQEAFIKVIQQYPVLLPVLNRIA